MHNAKIGKEEMRRIRANYPEIFARCQETYGCFIHATDPRATFEVTPEEREAFSEKVYGEPGFGIWMGNFRDISGSMRTRTPSGSVWHFRRYLAASLRPSASSRNGPKGTEALEAASPASPWHVLPVRRSLRCKSDRMIATLDSAPRESEQ